MQEQILKAHPSKKQYLIWILLSCLALFALVRIYFRITDDFRVANMTYEIPYHPEWDIPDPTPAELAKLKAILNQDFYYIGKGAQSYAFKSADEKYVLKFFKFKHLKPSLFVDFLPPLPYLKEYRDAQVLRKAKKLNSVFTGYHLAYAVHKNDSGLIFIHLNKSDNLHLQAHVKDKIGLPRTIDLDPIVFVIQEKAQTTRAVIIDLLNQNDLAGAKRHIRQIFDLYLTEYRKGIYDRDHGVMHNTGFVGDKPIHLDVGKLTQDDRMKLPEYYEPDLVKIAHKFGNWLKINYPNAYPDLMHDMEENLSEIFNKSFNLAR